jgi:hypothetical protein
MVGKLMHKSIIQKVHSRIGFWIKYQRKNRLTLTNDENFKQDRFILLNEGESYLDFVPNEAICSRSTLSRIENGKIVYEKSLITFFSKRFNKEYRISETDQHLIESTINAYKTYFFINNKISTDYLEKILDDTCLKIEDDFLWDEDKALLYKILEWFSNYTLIQKSEFDEYYQKFKIYHQSIQDILIFYLAISVYFNPELWSYNHLVSKLIKEEYSSNELLSVFEGLFSKSSNNIFRLFYQDMGVHKDSGFLKELVHASRLLFEKDNIFRINQHNLKYIQLTQKIFTRNFHSDSDFEVELFERLSSIVRNESFEISALLNSIKMEPYPRIVNKLVLEIIYPQIKTKSHFQLILSLFMA